MQCDQPIQFTLLCYEKYSTRNEPSAQDSQPILAFRPLSDSLHFSLFLSLSITPKDQINLRTDLTTNDR